MFQEGRFLLPTYVPQLLGTIDELQAVSKTIPTVLGPASWSALLPNMASTPAAVEVTRPNEASIAAHPVEASTAVLTNEAHTSSTQPVKASLTTQLNETSVANEVSTSAQPVKVSSDNITVGMKEGGSYIHHPSGTTTASGDHPIPPTLGPGSSSFNPPSSRPAQEGATITPHAPIPTCAPDTAAWRPWPAANGTDGGRMTSKMHHYSYDRRCVDYILL